MTNEKKKKDFNVPYQLFTLVLSFLVIGILLFESSGEVNEEVLWLLRWTDYGLCALFFLDFLYQIFTVENKKRYLITWGWIDLLSCIPIFGWGRVARIIRVLKLFKAIRSSQILFETFSKRKGESALLSAVMLLIFASLFGSVAILQCEMDEPDSTLTNASDAIWWTFCTILKGGCENYDPVSIEGRIIAVALMFIGMAVNGTVIGFAAMLLTSNRSPEPKDDLTDTPGN